MNTVTQDAIEEVMPESWDALAPPSPTPTYHRLPLWPSTLRPPCWHTQACPSPAVCTGRSRDGELYLEKSGGKPYHDSEIIVALEILFEYRCGENSRSRRDAPQPKRTAAPPYTGTAAGGARRLTSPDVWLTRPTGSRRSKRSSSVELDTSSIISATWSRSSAARDWAVIATRKRRHTPAAEDFVGLALAKRMLLETARQERWKREARDLEDWSVRALPVAKSCMALPLAEEVALNDLKGTSFRLLSKAALYVKHVPAEQANRATGTAREAELERELGELRARLSAESVAPRDETQIDFGSSDGGEMPLARRHRALSRKHPQTQAWVEELIRGSVGRYVAAIEELLMARIERLCAAMRTGTGRPAPAPAPRAAPRASEQSGRSSRALMHVLYHVFSEPLFIAHFYLITFKCEERAKPANSAAHENNGRGRPSSRH
ncbi:hypothetical protein WN55_08109 [Dufourea novaeangliae]|uniref:Uncharacterized protein n=1 Tax=Dufourea novaeangliae TaxID=178035 RepID=A0A154PU22_DUFNO|nr:hypothetical protein WN55_08109 [Dufourea novaeangliae]